MYFKLFQIFFLITFCQAARNRGNAVRDVTIIAAEVGKTYINSSDVTSELHFVYQLDMSNFPQKSVRLRTERLKGGDLEKPLRVSVRFDAGSLNWHLPFETGDVEYSMAERTLCPVPAETLQEVTIILSTANSFPIEFSIILFEIETFTVDINEQSKIWDLSYATPDYRYVDLSDMNEDALLQVMVTSKEDTCAIVSVQYSECPVSDMEETVRGDGAFQTMLGLSAFSINRVNKAKGAFIVFIVTSDDTLCGGEEANPSDAEKRTKSFTFEISDSLSKKKLGLEVGILTGLLILMGAITVAVTVLYSVYGKNKDMDERISKLMQEISRDSPTSPLSDNETSVAEEEDHDNRRRRRSNNSRNSNNDETDGREPLPRYVCDLATKNDLDAAYFYKSMFRKSDLYVWLVLMMGIFYGIPAIQLVLNYQKKLRQSGDQDLCFYNFLCAIPTSHVQDFNHIYSNIWYMGFGCLFLFLTWYRKREHLKFLQKWNEATTEEVTYDYGLPQHFGLFYAMGFALIFEGVLSACYHVCPTQENFQFDTTFMYVISSLCFIKIYQFRHPDVTSSAYKVFFGLGLIMLIEVLGIYNDNAAFWIVCLVLYFFVSIILTAIVYHEGVWSFDLTLFNRIYKSTKSAFTRRSCMKRSTRRNIILVILLNVMNMTFLIVGAVLTPSISSYILNIFICNLLVYTCYYISMKLYFKERITWTAYIYLFFSLLCWIPAMIFYTQFRTSYYVTPAESRDMNAECMLGELFDSHDVWHLLSAGGLFFCYMLLQTLDDGLCYVSRKRIHVF